MTNGDGPIALDVFCGAGGLSTGLARAGFRVVAGVDSWEKAIASYSLNFSHAAIQEDVARMDGRELMRTLAVEQVDLLAGGPPCQGFSIQRIGPDEDARNSLVLEFARMVAAIRPRVFLLENVPGLLGGRGRELAREFERQIARSGYDFRVQRVNAADYGVPQIRWRVFYYGWEAGKAEPPFPRPTTAASDYKTVWQAIGDLPTPPLDHRPPENDPLHRRSRLSQLNLARLAHIPPGGGFEHLPTDMRVNAHRAGPSKIGHRNVYGRLAPNAPSVTITARFDSFTRGKFAHPSEDRNITLREGARLQGFDDSHRFVGTTEDIAALIGNAVPPPLAEAIGRAFCDHLNGGARAAEEVAGQLALL